MSHDVGVWIDRKKAIIVSIAAREVTTRTLTSDIGAHPHYSGSQEGGGGKKYEQRHNQDLDRYYDDVIGLQAGRYSALWPGESEAATQRACASLRCVVQEHRCGRDHGQAQIVAKVKEHYGIAR